MGWGFDIFQKFAVKFPTRGQTIPVKCTKISLPRVAYCCQSFPGWMQERRKENEGKQENSIIFTTSQHYYVSKIQLRLIHCVYRITKSTVFNKQFVFSAKAAESITFEKSSRCSDWPVH